LRFEVEQASRSLSAIAELLVIVILQTERFTEANMLACTVNTAYKFMDTGRAALCIQMKNICLDGQKVATDAIFNLQELTLAPTLLTITQL